MHQTQATIIIAVIIIIIIIKSALSVIHRFVVACSQASSLRACDADIVSGVGRWDVYT